MSKLESRSGSLLIKRRSLLYVVYFWDEGLNPGGGASFFNPPPEGLGLEVVLD